MVVSKSNVKRVVKCVPEDSSAITARQTSSNCYRIRVVVGGFVWTRGKRRALFDMGRLTEARCRAGPDWAFEEELEEE